jgi:F0F1-type ATP synthase assembly protein I
MRGAGLVGVGVVLGWLASKTWSDPGCQLGLVVFLVVTAVMALGFLLAVVGHRREPGASDSNEDDKGDHP